LLARLKHAGTDDAFGVHENVRAAIIRFDESKPAMLVPSAAVALNSLAETTLQKIPPDPASAQCISKRRPSGTVRAPGRAWSAQSPEVVGDWMMLSQVELPRSLSFALVRSAACGRSI